MTEEKGKDNLVSNQATPVPQDNSQVSNNQANDELTKQRRQQQLEWSKSERDKAWNMAVELAAKQAAVDYTSLVELHEQDPKMANDVAKKFWYPSYKAAIASIEEEEKSQEDADAEFERRYQAKRQQEVHEQSLEKAQRIIDKLPADLKEKAQEYFDNIVEWKMLTEKTAVEFARMTTLYVNKDKTEKEDYDDGLWQLASTGISKSKKTKEEFVHIVQDWKLVLVPNTFDDD